MEVIHINEDNKPVLVTFYRDNKNDVLLYFKNGSIFLDKIHIKHPKVPFHESMDSIIK